MREPKLEIKQSSFHFPLFPQMSMGIEGASSVLDRMDIYVDSLMGSKALSSFC